MHLTRKGALRVTALLAAASVLLGVAPDVLRAQRPNVSGVSYRSTTPFIDRMNYYMDRGMLIGAAAGLISGFASEADAGAARNYRIMIHGAVGTGIGTMAGAVVGTMARSPARMRSRHEPYLGLEGTLEEAGKYIGLGGRLGAGTGMIYGLLTANEPGRDLVVF